MNKVNKSPISSLNGSGPKARPKRFFPDEVSDNISSDTALHESLNKPHVSKKKTVPVALVPWAAKITPELKARLNDMMQTAPRHVLMQDLVEFILTDFFERYPTLPQSLLTPIQDKK